MQRRREKANTSGRVAAVRTPEERQVSLSFIDVATSFSISLSLLLPPPPFNHFVIRKSVEREYVVFFYDLFQLFIFQSLHLTLCLFIKFIHFHSLDMSHLPWPNRPLLQPPWPLSSASLGPLRTRSRGYRGLTQANERRRAGISSPYASE